MVFLAALQFLTIIPVRRDFTAEQVGRSTGYFPLVGLAIGLILVVLNYLLGLLLPPGVVNVLLIVSLVVLTGALHLDGVADTCDGLAGHGTPQERWERMRDSRAGGFGVIGVALLLLVKYISLNSVPQDLMTFALLTAPVISRWSMVYAISACPYARPAGLGRAFKQATGWQQLLMATIVVVIVAGGLLRLAGIVVLALAWLLTVLIAIWLKRKFAGLTGDTYGAINEVIETGVFIVLSVLAYKQWLV